MIFISSYHARKKLQPPQLWKNSEKCKKKRQNEVNRSIFLFINKSLHVSFLISYNCLQQMDKI